MFPVAKSPPDVVEDIIISFFDAQMHLHTDQVNKLWHSRVKAADAREDIACVRLGYSREIVEAFRRRKLSVWRLPEISSSVEGLESDYVSLKNEDMPANSAPGAAYACARIHNRGRVGFALMLQGHAEGTMTFKFSGLVLTYPIKDLKFVMALHQRYSDPNSNWVSSYSASDILFNCAYGATKIERPDLMGQKNINPWLLQILDGKEPVFQLTGPIPQVAPLAVPHVAAPPPEAQPAEPEPNCCWFILSNLAQGIWNGLVALVQWLISWIR